jgi:hypothetical protein
MIKATTSTRDHAYSLLCVYSLVQGSVEEANYIREQEKIFFAKKKADMANKMVAADEKIYKEQIAPAMAEAESVLKPIGATLSRDGLEAIAKWKLGL